MKLFEKFIGFLSIEEIKRKKVKFAEEQIDIHIVVDYNIDTIYST